ATPSALLSRISQVAEALALTAVLDRRAGHLSGGQQRRVHVACALVHAPPVVLLDEPTSGVDAAARRGLVDLVRQLSSAGAAICYSTNQITDAEDLGGSVAILNRGEIVARDEVSALVAHHGRAVVEIELDADVGGPLGPSPAWSSAEVSGGRVVLTTDAPGPAIAAALAVLGGNARRLRSVDVTKAGLETVFLALTGERYSPGERAEAR
ncbi:MAG: ATP-binding cassette domain-containing protein, partial [Acidimicrobiales bacterium]